MIRWLPVLCLPTALLALGSACQAPFGSQRQELSGDRIVAMTVVRDGDDTVLPRVHLLQDGQTWETEPAEVTWAWVDPRDTDEARADVGRAPRLTLPAAETLVLQATVVFPSGARRIGRLTFPRDLPDRDSPPSLQIRPVELPTADAEEGDLDREARLDASEGRPLELPVVASDAWYRLDPGTDPARTRMRWMATAGTVLELTADVTDWASAEVVLDDGEVDEVTPLDPGPVTVVGLGLDDAGANTVMVREIHVEEPQGTGVYLAGRWVASDLDGLALAAGTLVTGRLTLDDGPAGLALVEAAVVAPDALPDDDAYGTEALDCAGPTTGPFDPSWLFSGDCTRDAVDGATVVGEVAW